MKYHLEFDIEFKRNPYKGQYIVLEGIDGSGKTTQIDLLYEYFRKQGKEVIRTREPRKDEGLIGELIQKILNGKTKVPSVAIQYLFSADRGMHHEELILPALKAGKIVISDRCFWSAVPYGVLDLEQEFTDNTAKYILVSQSILSMYHQFTAPDITFYLDIPVNRAMDRLDKKPHDKEIYEEEKKILKAKEGYDWLLKEFPREFKVINGARPVKDVTEEIIDVISRLKIKD
ncbi:MAG TPA: dTMP kinase [Candidatus Limnocylindrales bacterium]|nr:dTMP kinase [Candidatus Limnocylindrales bacterium]